MICTLSGSYYCFPVSPKIVLVLGRDIILFKEIQSRSQVDSFCPALVHRPLHEALPADSLHALT